jgi:hypothetical protein
MQNDNLGSSLKSIMREFARTFAQELVRAMDEKGIGNPMPGLRENSGGFTSKEALNELRKLVPHKEAGAPATPRLIQVSKWNKYYEYPRIGGLRHLIFHAKTNGFNKCLRRVGRSVLIHEQDFFDWVEEINK